MTSSEKVAFAIQTLKEIAEGAGPYSQDRLQHAVNTIEAMKKLALDCIVTLERNE